MTSVDTLAVMIWENNPDNWEVSENNSPYTLCDINRLVTNLEDIKIAKQARFIICLNEDDSPIGTIDLFSIDFELKATSVGILISEKGNRRKGYALESLELMESEIKELNIDKIEAKVHLNNKGSLNLFKKANYKKKQLNESVSENPDYLNVVYFEKWLKK